MAILKKSRWMISLLRNINLLGHGFGVKYFLRSEAGEGTRTSRTFRAFLELLLRRNNALTASKFAVRGFAEVAAPAKLAGRQCGRFCVHFPGVAIQTPFARRSRSWCAGTSESKARKKVFGGSRRLRGTPPEKAAARNFAPEWSARELIGADPAIDILQRLRPLLLEDASENIGRPKR